MASSLRDPSSPPSVCLLHDGLPTGGVATVVHALTQGLRNEGWQVQLVRATPGNWRALWRAARQGDVLLSAHCFYPAYLAWALGLTARRPVVVWVHGPLQEVLAQAGAGRGKRTWLRWLYARLPHCVFVSNDAQCSFERFAGPRLRPRQRRQVVRNPAPPAPRPVAGTEDGGGPRRVRLGFLGRLSAEKRPHLLIDTLRALPDHFELLIAGEGPLRSALEADAADLAQTGRIRFLGQLDNGADFCRTLHLTLMTSRYEGCPMAMLESFAAGVACVAVPIPSLQEILLPDAPYMLAREATAQALADAIVMTLDQPADRLQADIGQMLGRHHPSTFLSGWQATLREAARAC